ncbi:MAG: T9SS type A sorting domain-containing protein [Saprospiraceae bacterium]|nr:T9SS type A sorting domain-containing protein [Saprospiraceae bacterium]
MRQKMYSRKLRQLRYLAKTLTRLNESGQFETLVESKKAALLLRLRNLYQKLQGMVPGRHLRKALAGVAFVFSMGIGQHAQAQSFGPLQVNPFGLTSSGYVNFPVAADMDGDGDYDLIGILSYNSPVFAFFENTGTAAAPAFQAEQLNPFGLVPVDDITTATVGDLDGDGDLDILVGNYYNGGMHFYENTGTANAPAFASAVDNPFGLTPVYGYATPNLVDIDGDGDLDAIVGQGYGNTLFFENVGTPQVPDFAIPEPDAFGLASSNFVMIPVFADLDSDCDLDFMYVDYEYNTYTTGLYFQENNGSPAGASFEEVETNPFGLDLGGYFGFMTGADFDGDGDIDLLGGSNYYISFLYFENTSGQAAATDNVITLMEDGSYPFVEADFGFDNSNGDIFESIRIIETTQAGDLSLNGNPVSAFDVIDVADIPNLVFAPAAGEFGDPYDAFTFKVGNDSGIYSSAIYTMTLVVSEVSATTNVELAGAFRLSPNPVSDMLLLEADLTKQPAQLQVVIRNILGQTVDIISLDANMHIQQEINVSGLAAGSYSISLQTDEGSRVFRFQKI